jgi:hypothetical protein
LVTGIAVLWTGVNLTGAVGAPVVAAFYTYLTGTVAVMWWDVSRRGREPRVMLGIGIGLALMPIIGFRAWWRYGIRDPKPQPPTGGFA